MMEANAKTLEERIFDLEKQVSEIKTILTDEDSKSTIAKHKVKVSINEFIKSKNVQNDVQRTLVIAYWLDYFEIDFRYPKT
ncbi:MAG: hypothetical protein UT61_C0060G0004 [Candidatus Woesebacteria bacterium GW2011_GWA1_39_8]|uniref:Uncharacterized protein n=1 Tax=Candidatus Woesebacteria bacterium GW2011_GWA1_39_8 TaxID=1618552 RepID=A0A0G0PSB0_9BACT|nr:MAG: hypothetical protein UT61_C0060G0004 [Candidatus Woesebacteria bacterium GW2011_GWA1_39_8]